MEWRMAGTLAAAVGSADGFKGTGSAKRARNASFYPASPAIPQGWPACEPHEGLLDPAPRHARRDEGRREDLYPAKLLEAVLVKGGSGVTPRSTVHRRIGADGKAQG